MLDPARPRPKPESSLLSVVARRRGLPPPSRVVCSALGLASLALTTVACEEVPPCPGLPERIPSDWAVVPEGIDTGQWDSRMAEHMRSGCFPALSVAVVDEGGEILRAAWGYTHVEARTPATTSTPFMAASVSKAVGGLALVAAAEDGLLDFDDEVSDLVGFEVRNRRVGDVPPIRMRHLATHTSGIADNWDVLGDTYVAGDSELGLGAFLESYLSPGGERFDRSDNYFAWPPGREWMYSNVGTALAALAVQVQANEPYDAYCRRRLFDPLGLQSTGWFLADFPEPDLVARPHQATWEGWRVREHYGYPTYPDGQLRATASDLGRLLRLTIGDGEVDGVRVLAPGVREELTQRVPVRGIDDWFLREYFTAQHLFWFSTDLGSRRIVGHNGGDFGVSTEFFFDPRTDVGVVVLTNGDDGPVGDRLRAETRAIQRELFALGERR